MRGARGEERPGEQYGAPGGEQGASGGLEDLPADWWTSTGNSGGLTSEDVSGFKSLPGSIRSAVASGISGIKVTMDGQTVGNLVAPYVSQAIARDMVV